jgi:hypothetical protein
LRPVKTAGLDSLINAANGRPLNGVRPGLGRIVGNDSKKAKTRHYKCVILIVVIIRDFPTRSEIADLGEVAVGSLSRLAIGLLATWLLISGTSTPIQAVEIPKPVITIPKPNIPRPVINIPRPAVHVARPTINVPHPAITVPKVHVPKSPIVVTVPKADAPRRTVDVPKGQVPKSSIKLTTPKEESPHRTVDVKSDTVIVPKTTEKSFLAAPKTAKETPLDTPNGVQNKLQSTSKQATGLQKTQKDTATGQEAPLAAGASAASSVSTPKPTALSPVINVAKPATVPQVGGPVTSVAEPNQTGPTKLAVPDTGTTKLQALAPGSTSPNGLANGGPLNKTTPGAVASPAAGSTNTAPANAAAQGAAPTNAQSSLATSNGKLGEAKLPAPANSVNNSAASATTPTSPPGSPAKSSSGGDAIKPASINVGATAASATQPTAGASSSLKTPALKAMATASPSSTTASSSTPPLGTVTFNGSTPTCNPSPCNPGQTYTAGNGTYAGADVIISGTGAVTPTTTTTTKNGITSTITAGGSAQQTNTVTVNGQTYTVNGGGPTNQSGNVLGQQVNENRVNGTSTVSVGGAPVGTCGYASCIVDERGGAGIQSQLYIGAGGTRQWQAGEVVPVQVARLPGSAGPVPKVGPGSPGWETNGRANVFWTPHPADQAAKLAELGAKTTVDLATFLSNQAREMTAVLYNGVVNSLANDPSGGSTPVFTPVPTKADGYQQNEKSLQEDLIEVGKEGAGKLLGDAVGEKAKQLGDKLGDELKDKVGDGIASQIGPALEEGAKKGTEKLVGAVADSVTKPATGNSAAANPSANANAAPNSPTVNVPYSIATNPAQVSPLIAANPPPAPPSALDAMLSPNAPAASVNALMSSPGTSQASPNLSKP